MERFADHYLNTEILLRYGPEIVAGIWVTLGVAVATVAIGIGLGLAMAIALVARVPVLRWVVACWIEVFRTLPQLAVIIFVYFGLPYAGVTISPFAPSWFRAVLTETMSKFEARAEIVESELVADPFF